jgi:hypothetical protein
MKVQNMTGANGNKVANQFIIMDATMHALNGQYFQSYDTIIAFRSASGAVTYLDRDKWDYSTATGKYRNMFLNEKKADTQRKIDSGEYILADLNQ